MIRALCLTVALETAFFACTRYRSALFLTLAAAVNAFTNLAANAFVRYVLSSLPHTAYLGVIALIEAAVVIAEYAVYAAARGRSRRLLLMSLGANALSFGAGLLLP